MTMTLHFPDGTDRIYALARFKSHWDRIFFLTKEIIPNGKVVRYSYDEKGNLDRIESLDPNERFVYASLRLEHLRDRCQFTSSTGAKAIYNYEIRELDVKIKGGHQGRKEKFKSHSPCPPLLTSVISPFFHKQSIAYCDRFLLSAYSGKDEVFQIGQRWLWRKHPLPGRTNLSSSRCP